MGKIRIKTYGEEAPKKEKIKPKKEDVKVPGLKGGQKLKTIGVSPEDLEKQPAKQTPQAPAADAGKSPDKSDKTKAATDEEKTTDKKKKQKFVKVKVKSKRYLENKTAAAKQKTYNLSQALDLLTGFKKASFDETVELHLNVKEKGISGQIVLPHGTGKKIRIKVADDALIDAVSKGKIDFDILIAAPQIMGKLAKIARILGPKGLMPNPKAGTITDKPEKLIEKLSRGQVNYKTEASAPIIHMTVGKLSFDKKNLKENIETVLASVGTAKIANVTLKSTMSPAIKLQIQ